MKSIPLKYFFIFLASLICANLFAQTEVQKRQNAANTTQLTQFVTDETGTLTQAQLNSLNSKLQAEEKETSNQIIVYIIKSLDGESLEDLSIRLAERNKIGKKDKNNGVLLLVVKDDRKARIEVGYGLEGALTDAKSSQILRREMFPSFKNGNYYEGIDKAVNAIISTVKGEYSADKGSPEMNVDSCFGIPIFVIIIFGLIIFFIFISIIKSMFGAGRSIYSNKKGWYSGWGGGWGGSSGSSGGFGGGGFSGGGGSFGGGGASGSW